MGFFAFHDKLNCVEQVGTVASLWRYPVKSMGGERVRQVHVGPLGLRGDRRLAFRSAGAAAGKPMVTGEERNALLRCSARFLSPPGTDDPVEPATAEITRAGLRYRADDPAAIAALQTGLEKQNPMWLAHDDRPFMDCRPIALMSLQTLRHIGEKMGFPVEAQRFRENILLDLPEFPGFGEDAFVGRTLRIGQQMEITIKERDPRCRIITIDPATGETLPELMRYIAREHENRAGIYGIAVVPGSIAEGDPVMLLDR